MEENLHKLHYRMTIYLYLVLSLCYATPEADPKASFDAVPYCSNRGYCVPPVACAPWYLNILHDRDAACYLAPGTPGVCCPDRIPSCKYLNHKFT